MPTRGPTVCGHCGKAHGLGERCLKAVAAAKARNAHADARRPSARQRGYDAQWEAAARAFLAEPGHQRCSCGAPATVVRHIISIRKRPDLRMVRSNWQSGCKRCNALDAARDKREAR